MPNAFRVRGPRRFKSTCVTSKCSRNSFSKKSEKKRRKRFIPRRSLAAKGFAYGELSRAISRGWANNCVYPVSEGSNVILTTLHCRKGERERERERGRELRGPTTRNKILIRSTSMKIKLYCQKNLNPLARDQSYRTLLHVPTRLMTLRNYFVFYKVPTTWPSSRDERTSKISFTDGCKC